LLNVVSTIEKLVKSFVVIEQFIDLANSSQIIDKIKIEVYDRFNNQILNNNADYSLTLEFEYNN